MPYIRKMVDSILYHTAFCFSWKWRGMGDAAEILCAFSRSLF